VATASLNVELEITVLQCTNLEREMNLNVVV